MNRPLNEVGEWKVKEKSMMTFNDELKREENVTKWLFYIGARGKRCSVESLGSCKRY